jgi:hypothetical protein
MTDRPRDPPIGPISGDKSVSWRSIAVVYAVCFCAAVYGGLKIYYAGSVETLFPSCGFV